MFISSCSSLHGSVLLKVLNDTAIALKFELYACEFINTVSKNFKCMVACRKVFVTVCVCVYVFFLTCSFTFFTLLWLCKFQSLEPEIKSHNVQIFFLIYKLDPKVCSILLSSTIASLRAQNLLLS